MRQPRQGISPELRLIVILIAVCWVVLWWLAW